LSLEFNLQVPSKPVACRGPGYVLHSDRGCQFTSFTFGRRCEEAGIAPSMGSAGDAYDKALIESFFATLETELLVACGQDGVSTTRTACTRPSTTCRR
jgi:putative transposase